ncbi:NAD(P)/FAD-dependent oxidoreductase [Mesorhizobium sp. SB112]|uniref:NAD(P)/FAD-dependent oxidoreductase n=1 Tax=Mesorhizobium sp. SB112 TaxID=3151853 RepID=UPI003267E5BA
MDYDAVIIGGSYAGLSAGLQLARARRSILVIDGGVRRNRFASASHGFLTQDGSTPADIAAKGKAQLLAYDTVAWMQGHAERAEAIEGGFRIYTPDKPPVTASRIVLAMGVIDDLPEIPGLSERWGKSVFHCPYCHGYELQQGRIGVLASSPLSMHHAILLPDWGPTTLFLNGAFEPDDEQLEKLKRRGVKIERELIERLAGDNLDVILKDGRAVPLDGMFTITNTRVSSPIAEQLGCAFDDGPLGAFIRTDGMKATTVPGVFACGDAARATGSLPLAVGDGAMAGSATHQSLIFAA